MYRNVISGLKITLFVAIILFVSACAKERKVVIISTNDIHAAIERVPQLATVVERCRQANPDEVILVDAGDRWTGNPFVDLANEPGAPIIDLMNDLDYDVATVGNHEFDMGQERLEERIDGMDFDLVVANMETGDTPLRQPRPYVIREVNGVKLGFIGLVTNFINGHPDGEDEVFEGLSFSSPYEAAERYRTLRDSVDVLVAVTHIGDDADSILATRMPELDLIVGGHTHTIIDRPRIYGKTMVTQTGKSLRYAGITTLTVKKGKILAMDNQLIALDTVTPSVPYSLKVTEILNNPRLIEGIGRADSLFNKTAVANLMTDCIREATESDLAFYHIGGVRVDSIPAGKISIANLFSIEPFRSEITTMTLSVPEIKELIINKFNDSINPKESHRPDIYPSGVSYTILTDATGEAVDVEFDPVLRKERYRVAMADYMYNTYRFTKPTDAKNKGLLVTDILKEHIEESSPIRPDAGQRIRIETTSAD